MGVGGLARDPAIPPRGPRQTPPLPIGRERARLAAAFDGLGWHWWVSDAAINAAPYGGRGACNRCGPAISAGDGRAQFHGPHLLAARPRRRRQARPEARVFAIETDAAGRPTAVAHHDATGAARRIAAHRIVLAANGVGAAWLLLLSAGKSHPDGLGNRSGLVGRRLMHHPTGMATGVFEDPVDGFKGPLPDIDLWQECQETDRSRGFVRGFRMQVRSDGPLGTSFGVCLPTAWEFRGRR